MSNKMAKQISKQDIIKCLTKYVVEKGIHEINSETRYFLKKIAIDYVIECIGLNNPEQKNLKELLSQRICLEEASANQLIPAKYLAVIMKNLPEDAKKLNLVKLYSKFSNNFSISEVPAPFHVADEGPYIRARQEGIEALLDLAKRVNGQGIASILDKSGKMDEFNSYGELIKNVLDSGLLNIRPSSN